MIKPIGSDTLNPLFVADDSQREALIEEGEKLPSLLVSSATAANAVMFAGGYFNPLTGYMNLADGLNVAQNMKTTSGQFFPVPILNLVESTESIGSADRIALRDPNVEGNPVIAIQQIESIETVSDEQMALMTEKVYATSDSDHPGVAAFNAQGQISVSGDIQALNYSYFATDFANTFRTAVEIRSEIEKRGWQRVVAFQTRNPMHLAHEELCHMAMDRLNCDGLVIHMLLGKLKPGDIPADGTRRSRSSSARSPPWGRKRPKWPAPRPEPRTRHRSRRRARAAITRDLRDVCPMKGCWPTASPCPSTEP